MPTLGPYKLSQPLGAGGMGTVWAATQFRESYVEALWNTVSGLGDRDTTCAIVGGIVVLATGAEGVPSTWVSAREPLP